MEKRCEQVKALYNKIMGDRKKNVEVALAMNSLDAIAPSEYCIQLLNEYTKGNVEAKDITNRLIEKYKNNDVDIDKAIENVKASLAIEGLTPSDEVIEITRRHLLGVIPAKVSPPAK